MDYERNYYNKFKILHRAGSNNAQYLLKLVGFAKWYF